MRPDRDINQALDLGISCSLNEAVCAFGAPWFNILEHQLEMTPLCRLGRASDHTDYGSSVASRRVTVYCDEPSGSAPPASAGPPSRAEALLLRERLITVLG